MRVHTEARKKHSGP